MMRFQDGQRGMASPAVRRLNWGCGPCATPGWINADERAGNDIQLVGDIRDGLDLPSNCMDYVVAIHVLQDLRLHDIPAALTELKRVLAPGGILRLGLPDLDRAIHAYLKGDHGYFYVPDRDARTIGAKLVNQIVWYGSVRTPMMFSCVQEWLGDAGFEQIQRCEYGRTASACPEIVTLDNRPRESMFIEAIKP